MTLHTPAVRPLRLASSPLWRLSYDPSRPDAPLAWEWFPWREEAWRQRTDAPFGARLRALADLEAGTWLAATPTPDAGALCARTDDLLGVPLDALLRVHPRLAWRVSALVLAGALDATLALHGAGLTLGYASPRDLWLTPEGRLVIPHAGLLPLWRDALGAELQPASAQWLLLYPEPRLLTARLLGKGPLDEAADRQWLTTLLEFLIEPRRALPEGGVFGLYRAIREGTRRPPHPMPPEARAIWMLLDDPRVPLPQVAARLRAEPLEPPADLRQRARPLSETWTQPRSADGTLGPEVDVRALDLHVALGVPKREPRQARRRGWGRTLLWAMLLTSLLGLAASTLLRGAGCSRLAPGLDLDELGPAYTPLSNPE